MSTWDARAQFAPAQNFHPEFGYLCPSAGLRRRVRSVAVTLLAGMAIASGMALAVLPQLVPQLAPQAVGEQSVASARREPVLSAMALPPVDQSIDTAAAVAEDSKPVPTLRAAAAERAAPARAQASCDDLSGSFLAPQCQLGKAGKSHMTRTARAPLPAGSRVAAFRIGRADVTLEAEAHEAGAQRAAASRTAPSVETPAVAADANEASTAPSQKSAAADKKPVKTAPKQPLSLQAPGRNLASLDTAPAPSPGFDLFGLFHQPPRTGNGIWTMQW